MSGCGDFVSVSMIILLGFGAVIKACFFHIYCRVVLKQRAEIEVFLSGQNVTSLRKHVKLPRIQNSPVIAITLTDDRKCKKTWVSSTGNLSFFHDIN